MKNAAASKLSATMMTNLQAVAAGEFRSGLLGDNTIKALVLRGLIVDGRTESDAAWALATDEQKAATRTRNLPGTEMQYRLFYPFTLTDAGRAALV